MASIEENKYITQKKFLCSLVITFIIGFLCGIVFTAYKTGPTHSNMNEKQPETETKQKMAQALEAEVALQPDNADLWIQLGHMYFDTKAYEKAISAYEKSLKLRPKNSNVLTDLGVMYRRTKQPQKAIICFDKAVQNDPSHETSRFNKGIVLMYDLKNQEGAIQVWQELLDRNPLFVTPSGKTLDELLRHYAQKADK